MEERAQGQFELLLVAVIVIGVAAAAALYMKYTANTASGAVNTAAKSNPNN